MDFDEGMKTCSNCERTFAENKIDLHEAYCCRNFRKCEFCGVMIDRNYLSDHQVHYIQKFRMNFIKKKNVNFVNKNIFPVMNKLIFLFVFKGHNIVCIAKITIQPPSLITIDKHVDLEQKNVLYAVNTSC